VSDLSTPETLSADLRKKKKSNIKISWKSVQWGPSCSMRPNGKTDRRTKRS